METRVRTSLDWKLAAFVGLVVVLTAAGLGIASYIFARQTLRRQIHDRLSVVVSDRQKLLVAFIQQQQDKALLVASRTRVRQMVEEVQSGQMPVDRFRVESRRYLLDSQRSTEGMRAIWVADPSGRVIAGTDDAHLGEDLSGATEFVEGRRAAQFYLRHDREDRDEALMSAPAFGSSGQLVGVVLLTVDAKPLMEMLADRTGLGRTGVVVLGRRAGENIRYMLVPDAGTQSFELPSAQVPAMAAATAGQVGFQQTRDWRGVEVLAAYRPVGYRDWGLVTKIDVVEAYAPVAWLRRLFLIIGIMVLVLGLSGSYLLARRFTRPILRLAGMAESIAAGNLNARVVVEANDEVGALGAAFNRMTEELSHSHAIMENRVRERTAELATANEALQAQIAERKQAEQARERERELLRIIIDNLPDYICLKDDQSRFLLNNQAHLLVLGAHSQEDTLGKTDFDFFPRDLAEGYFADEQEIIRTGKPLLDYEQPRINKAGHPQWVVASKVPWRDAEGKTVGVLGISRNITERKQREQALHEAEAKYRQLVEQLPAITYIAEFGPEGRWLYVSPQVEAMLGFSAAEWMSQPDLWIKQLYADDRERVLREEAQSRETREPFRSEYRLLARDGRVLWVRDTATVVLDTAGQPQYLHGVMLDITARKLAEEQLGNYFALSLDLFCIADFRGYFQRLNPAWEQVLGYSLPELMARPFMEFVHAADREATLKELEKLRQGGRTIQFENRYRRKNGSYCWLQWNSISIPDQQVVYAVARDVSDHKRAQELLAGFADVLNRKNQEMQEDLKMAREVHQVFVPKGYPVFPRSAPPEKSALRFSHRYLPTSALGGDFFEILPLSDTEAGAFICDVMGHGMRAALVTSIVRGLMDKYRDRAREPDRFLAEINLALLANLQAVSTTIFATACYAVVDIARGELRYANAGHPSPLLLRQGTRTVERLGGEALSHAPALGLMREAAYPVTSLPLVVGDALLLFTDGLYEVEGRDGKQFGFERLQEAVGRRIGLPAGQLLDELVAEARRHAASGEFGDDVCLLEIEFAARIGGAAVHGGNEAR